MAKPAFEQIWKSITGTPAGQLTRYRFGNFNADGDLAQVSAEGGNAVGVIYEPNKVGQPTQVVAAGFAFIELGDTVAAGDAVMSDAQGRAIPFVPGEAPDVSYKLGTLAVGGVSGDIGTILLG